MFGRIISRSVLLLVCFLGAWPPTSAVAQPKAAPPDDLESRLDRRHDFQFRRAHFVDVVDTLRREFKLDVRLDRRSIDAVGISLDRPKDLKE